MKKYIFLLLFLLTLPAYSACPIDGESVCTLPEFREEISPIFKQSSGIQTNINTSPGQLQPLNRADPMADMRKPENNINYNSGCQFGVCLQNPNQSRLTDNKDIGN